MFFGAMFITMECMARLGLIKWIGTQTEHLILMVDEELRLALAIVIILWVSNAKKKRLVCLLSIRVVFTFLYSAFMATIVFY